VTYSDLRVLERQNPPFRAEVIHKMALAVVPGKVGPKNVKMGKRELGCFLAKSRTKWHPNGGQRGVKWGVVTKVRSRKSNFRNATYERPDLGLGTRHWGWNADQL
jgi:hypothetical protein